MRTLVGASEPDEPVRLVALVGAYTTGMSNAVTLAAVQQPCTATCNTVVLYSRAEVTYRAGEP